MVDISMLFSLSLWKKIPTSHDLNLIILLQACECNYLKKILQGIAFFEFFAFAGR